MNERQALSQGLYYTGISFRYYDTEKANFYKKRVSELKKKYKVRVVKVADGEGFYSYYGDDNFHLIQHDGIEDLEKRLNEYIPQRIVEAKKEYENVLANIEKDRLDIIDKMNKVKEIMK